VKTAAFFRPGDPTTTYRPGEIIFSEGDIGREMFGVLEGEVELRNGDQVVERLGPAGVFGEMALIDNSARNLTAVAVSDCQLATIDRKLFLFLVHETPTFALDVMSGMAERLRALNHPERNTADGTS
jgi:CRP/FNR family cyclic AMP-dependent transcriptional regulator